MTPPQGFTFCPLSRWKAPGLLRTSPVCSYTEGKLRQESSGLRCCLALACGTEHPSCVRAVGGGEPLPGLVTAAPSSLLPLPGSSFHRAPPSLCHPHPGAGMAQGSSDTDLGCPAWGVVTVPLCCPLHISRPSKVTGRKDYSWGRFPIWLGPSRSHPSKSPPSSSSRS